MGVIYLLYQRKLVESMREKYPPGTRVEVISLCNEEEHLKPGTKGTVVGVDDQAAPGRLSRFRALRLLPFPGNAGKASAVFGLAQTATTQLPSSTFKRVERAAPRLAGGAATSG